MPPDRIMFIRHAEKPDNGKDGVAMDGSPDAESLTVRGWQRARALIVFFCAEPKMRPNAIFASGIGHGSKSKRPVETVTPLAAKLNETQPVAFDIAHLKDDVRPLDGQGSVPWGDGAGVLGAQAHSRTGRPSARCGIPFPKSGRMTALTWSGCSTARVRTGPFRRYCNACFRGTATTRSGDRPNSKSLPQVNSRGASR
jgi:hypothetical protein